MKEQKLELPNEFEIVEPKGELELPSDFQIVEDEDEKKKKAATTQDAGVETNGVASQSTNLGLSSTPVDASVQVDNQEEAEEVEDPKTTKILKKEFKEDFGVTMKNINDAVKSDVEAADNKYKDNLKLYFPEGLEKYQRKNDKGELYYEMSSEEQELFNKALKEYKDDMTAIDKKYESVNSRIDAYNHLAEEENKKAHAQLNKKILEDKQYEVDLDHETYFQYDRNGNLVSIMDAKHIRDTWVDRPDLSIDQFKTLPENKGLSNAEIKKKYKNSIYAQPKYDSIDDYVAAWNQTKRNGYLQKVNKIIEPDDDVYNLNLLPEYEVISNGQVVEPSYVTKDDRLDYFNNNITTDLFINQGEGQVISALEQVMPEGFELEEEGYFGRDQIRITHKGSDDTIVVDVDYSDDAEGRRYARHNLKVFNNFLAAHSDVNTVNQFEENFKKIGDLIKEAELTPSNEGGLNVQWKKPEIIKEYATSYDDKTGDFSVNMFEFANVVIPAYDPSYSGSVAYIPKEDRKELNREELRAAQQVAFNSYIQENDLGITGEIEYSTMPTYTAVVEKGGFGQADKLTGDYDKAKGTKSKKSQYRNIQGYEAAEEFSIDSEEAMFIYFDKKEGVKKVFNTQEWSEANGGASFTEFINKKAINETVVEQRLFEESKRAFENYVEVDRWESEERKVQGTFILTSMKLKQNQKKALYNAKNTERNLTHQMNIASTNYIDMMSSVLNVPGYNVPIRPGEELVEVTTNYKDGSGELAKVIVPKRFTDGQKAEADNLLNLNLAYKKNGETQIKLIDDIEDVNTQWEVYKLNYSDLQSNTQNFAFSVANVVTDIAYGAYKYLTPYGWTMSALSGSGVIKEDPLTQAMMTWKGWQNKMNSPYAPPPKFGEFKTAGEFGSWFWHMTGTQMPQFAVMLFSGGSATIPMVAMGAMSAGQTDIDMRNQVISGERSYNEFGILWRSVLSGVSESTFATLPTWKILNKGKSLVKGVGGNATTKYAEGAMQYLKQQAPSIIADQTVDASFEVVNGVVQNVLNGRHYTEGLSEIAATSILSSGPVATISPVYYALTTKNFIGARQKNEMDKLSFDKNELQLENKRIKEQINNHYLRRTIDPVLVKNLNLKLADNNKAIEDINVELSNTFDQIDALYKNVGIQGEGNANFAMVLARMSDLKAQATKVNNDNSFSSQEKTQLLDKINTEFLQLQKDKNFYTSKKYFGNAFYALKGASVFNSKAKQEYNSYIQKATDALSEKKKVSQQDIIDKANDLYDLDKVNEQIAKDIAANPDLRVAEDVDQAKEILIESGLDKDLVDQQIEKLEKGSKNGLFYGDLGTGTENFLIYKPNMLKNQRFNTGGHETSHSSSAELIRKSPEKFKAFGEQIVSYMENLDPKLWRVIVESNSGIIKDGKWDYEEVIASFVENVGNKKIKLNKKGNMPALLGFLLNKGLDSASDGDFSIPFRGQNDVVQYFISLAQSLNEGSINIGTYSSRVAEIVDTMPGDTKVIDINTEVGNDVAIAASDVKSSDKLTVLEEINSLIPKDIKTKEDFENFTRDPRKFNPLYYQTFDFNEGRELGLPINKDGVISNYVKSKSKGGEYPGAIQSVRDRLANFDPEAKRADGSTVGVEGFGEFIFANTNFGKMDSKKSLAKEADKNKTTKSIDSDEARQLTSPNTNNDTVEDKKARVTPKSKIPKDFPEVINKELKEEFETAAVEIYESELPPISEKDFKSVVTDLFRGKMTDKVKKALGNNKMYEFTVKKMAPVMKDLLPIQWFVRLESQVKPENRIFTKPPVRLTKQADIDKALDNDKVYVENTKQGVNLYEFKDFKPQDLIDFLLPPLKITSKKTGKEVRSGLRGNRKTAVAEGITDQLGRDASPSAAKKAGKTANEIAEISRKMQVDPNIKFSAVYSKKFVENLGVNYLIGYNSKGDPNVQDIRTFKRLLQKYYPFIAGTVGSGTFANIDKGLAKGQNLNAEDRLGVQLLLTLGRQGDIDSIYVPFKNEKEADVISKEYNGEVLNNEVKINLEDLNKSQLETIIKKYSNRSDRTYPLSETQMDAVVQTFTTLGKAWKAIDENIDGYYKDETYKNERENNYKGLGLIISEFDKIYKRSNNKPEVVQMIAGILRTASQNSSHMFRVAAFPSGNTSVYLQDGKKVKEHVIPQADLADFVLTVITDNSLDTDLAIKLIKDNFLQLYISKSQDGMLKAPGFQSKMPDMFWDSWYEALRTGDLSKAMPFEVRYFHPDVNAQINANDGSSGFNPFETFVLGESVAEKYKLQDILTKDQMKDPNVIALTQQLIFDLASKQTDTKAAQDMLKLYVKDQKAGVPPLQFYQEQATRNNEVEIKNSEVSSSNSNMDMETLLNKASTLDKALNNANSLDQPIKKIRVFDFDDTLATSNNIVIATKDGKTIRLNAEEFAKQGLDLKEEGWNMDFSDFNNVTEGGRGPLFDVAQTIKKARGNEDLFVLTARAPQAQEAIYEFLKAEGLEFKKENIIGLGNSTGEAKAEWLVGKAAEGYNDFYFADDAMQNVAAVKLAMSQLDVKSKVQQAKIKSSEQMSIDFNKLLEETTGVEFYKEYSPVKAKTVGANKGKFKFFVPYSAEDFLGLIYPTLTKGIKGDKQMAWYKKHLIDPYTKAQENLSAARLNLMNDFKTLKKSLDVPKDLRKKNETGLTNEQAVRVYLYDLMGHSVPGLSKTDLQELKNVVENNPKLKMFAEQILTITKGDGYIKPKPDWQVGTITTDLIDLINTEKRSKYLAEWQQNVDAIYSEKNLNKLEALYGTKYREALEGMLKRMKSGRNRLDTGNRLSNQMLDYVNGSIGTIMFFNTRSAVLQTISSINYINWSFNNPLQAGAAFANQKQYWKDFAKLINSDYLKDRRNGLKLNIQESEIADAAATSKNKAKAVLNYILQKGYLPTQYADSFAIAAGGATFYRNRIKDLVKNSGMTESQAEAQALIEWRQISEESQQSSDPSRISAQQSSDLGRLILAFGNTPMQYVRIQKRAIQDLINGRGDAKSNVSKIIYYGFVQNIIFNALQQAVFALGFGDEEDDEVKNKKYERTINGILDSQLRGLGIGGVAVSTAKNFLLDIYERSGRKRPEYVDAVWKLMQFSPPISSKISKLKQAAWHFDSKKRREKIFEKGFALDNPAYEAFAKVISATANIPIDRLFYKMKNIEGALNEDNDMWQRIAMLAGWPEWQLKEKGKQPELTPEQVKQVKKNKALEVYKAAKGSTDYDTIKKLTAEQQIKMLKGLGYGEYTIKNAKTEKQKIDLIIYKNKGGKIKVDKKAVRTAKYKALNKDEQIRKLDSLGLSKAEIAKLKYEKDRVAKLLELMK